MHVPATVLIPMEALSTCAMATAFGASLSTVYSIIDFFDNRLNAGSSSDLTIFATAVPISMSYLVVAITGGFLALVAFVVSIVDTCNRARAKESCSFEPSASSLGMGYSQEAIMPIEVRSRVPTMYLPNKPQHMSHEGIIEDQEKGFAKEVGYMPRSDSAFSTYSEGSEEIERQIVGPLDIMRPKDTLIVRPARPWSEPRSPKRRDDVIHAM